MKVFTYGKNVSIILEKDVLKTREEFLEVVEQAGYDITKYEIFIEFKNVEIINGSPFLVEELEARKDLWACKAFEMSEKYSFRIIACNYHHVVLENDQFSIPITWEQYESLQRYHHDTANNTNL